MAKKATTFPPNPTGPMEEIKSIWDDKNENHESNDELLTTP